MDGWRDRSKVDHWQSREQHGIGAIQQNMQEGRNPSAHAARPFPRPCFLATTSCQTGSICTGGGNSSRKGLTPSAQNGDCSQHAAKQVCGMSQPGSATRSHVWPCPCCSTLLKINHHDGSAFYPFTGQLDLLIENIHTAKNLL